MKPEVTPTKIQDPPFERLLNRLNRILLSIIHLEINKSPDEITLAEVFGNIDAWGYLFLFFSLVTALVTGVFSGMLLLSIWTKPSSLVFLGAIPGVIAGFLVCYFLFWIKHWLKS